MAVAGDAEGMVGFRGDCRGVREAPSPWRGGPLCESRPSASLLGCSLDGGDWWAGAAEGALGCDTSTWWWWCCRRGMPRAVARAWVSRDGPWGLCRTAGPRAYLTSAWDGAAEITVAGAEGSREAVPGASSWGAAGDGSSGVGGVGGVGGVRGGGDTGESDSSCSWCCSCSWSRTLCVADGSGSDLRGGGRDDEGGEQEGEEGGGGEAGSPAVRPGLTTTAAAAFSGAKGGVDMGRTSGGTGGNE